jgi:hypothetical protein
MSSFPIIKFLFRKPWPILAEAMGLQPKLEVDEIPTVNEVVTYLSMSDQPMGLIITAVYDKNDLLQMANLIKMAKKVLPQTNMKVVMINFSMDKTLETAANKIGIKDIIDSGINTKALRFKLDFLIKALNTSPKTSSPNEVTKKLDPELTKKAPEQSVKFADPLDCVDDVWCLNDESDAKKILGRWIIKFKGPGPYAAQWVDHAKGIWRFEFKKEVRDTFIMGDGDWFFRGEQKPDFIWKENLWLFTGESFELFYQQGKDIFQRAFLKNKILTISKNSDYAKNKKNSILESFDQDLIIKKDGHLASGLESIEAETSKITNLAGKSKTDIIQNESLEGKLKTEKLGGKLLQGKFAPEGVPKGELSQKLKPGENQLNVDPLGLDIELDQGPVNGSWQHSKIGFNQGENLKAKSEIDIKSKYQGKSKKFDLDQEIELDKKKSRDKKDQHNADEDYSGYSYTDQLDTFYEHSKTDEKNQKSHGVHERSKNDEKQLDSLRKSKFSEDSQSPYGGKTETDKIKSYYDNFKDQKQEKSNSEKNARSIDFKEQDQSFDHADQVESDSLFSQGSKNSLLAKKSNKATSEQAIQDPDYGGKSETEHFSNFYSSKKNKEENEKKSSTMQQDSYHPGKALKNSQKLKIFDPLESELELDEELQERNFEHGNNAFSSLDEIKLDFPLNGKQSLGSLDFSFLSENTSVSSVLSQEDLNIICQLDDFFNSQIIFKTAFTGLTRNQVIMDLNFKFQNKITHLNLDGNIVSTERDEEGTHFITVLLSDQRVKDFELFMELFGKRQKRVDQFLKKARGL